MDMRTIEKKLTEAYNRFTKGRGKITPVTVGVSQEVYDYFTAKTWPDLHKTVYPVRSNIRLVVIPSLRGEDFTLACSNS